MHSLIDSTTVTLTVSIFRLSEKAKGQDSAEIGQVLVLHVREPERVGMLRSTHRFNQHPASRKY